MGSSKPREREPTDPSSSLLPRKLRRPRKQRRLLSQRKPLHPRRRKKPRPQRSPPSLSPRRQQRNQQPRKQHPRRSRFTSLCFNHPKKAFFKAKHMYSYVTHSVFILI